MFTTLTTVNSRRLLPKFVSEALEYKGFTYYTTRLYSKRSDNRKITEKFSCRAQIPVIEEQSPIVLDYKMLLLANSVLERSFKSIGIFDTDGRLAFLLPHISEKCGSISVFTENTAAYSSLQNEILNIYGTPVILSDKISAVFKDNIIFAANVPPIFKGPNVFTLKNTLNKTVVPPFSIPDYADKFSVLAGLYYYGGFKELGKLAFREGIKEPLPL